MRPERSLSRPPAWAPSRNWVLAPEKGEEGRANAAKTRPDEWMRSPTQPAHARRAAGARATMGFGKCWDGLNIRQHEIRDGLRRRAVIAGRHYDHDELGRCGAGNARDHNEDVLSHTGNVSVAAFQVGECQAVERSNPHRKAVIWIVREVDGFRTPEQGRRLSYL